jgi:hypothetical protein
MEDRRIEPRLMCAELVELEWRDKSGRQRSEMANLEDLSVFGACIQCENLVKRGTPVVIRYGNGELPGVVRYCFYRDEGYFLGIEFSEGCKWSSEHFQPKHLLDFRALVNRAANRQPRVN